MTTLYSHYCTGVRDRVFDTDVKHDRCRRCFKQIYLIGHLDAVNMSWWLWAPCSFVTEEGAGENEAIHRRRQLMNHYWEHGYINK